MGFRTAATLCRTSDGIGRGLTPVFESNIMQHRDHVNLLREGVQAQDGVWADLGAGSGAFTLALADLIGTTGVIHAVDRDNHALRENERACRTRFPRTVIKFHAQDFTEPMPIPTLDGIVMANSLHFHSAQLKVLKHILKYLKPGGVFLLVEYNSDAGNTWVPYPFSFNRWKQLANDAGLVNTRQLATYPSRFLHEIYSAASELPAPALNG